MGREETRFVGVMERDMMEFLPVKQGWIATSRKIRDVKDTRMARESSMRNAMPISWIVLTWAKHNADNAGMVAFLEGQIDSLGKQVEAFPRGGETAQLRDRLEEAVSLALDYFNRLKEEVERALPPNQWREDVARQFVPRYKAWFAMADKTLAFVREAKAKGLTTPSAGEFMRAYLEADAIANHFDEDLEMSRRVQRGEHPVGRPVQEQLDELLGHDRAGSR
jgi:hypothetical protein